MSGETKIQKTSRGFTALMWSHDPDHLPPPVARFTSSPASVGVDISTDRHLRWNWRHRQPTATYHLRWRRRNLCVTLAPIDRLGLGFETG